MSVFVDYNCKYSCNLQINKSKFVENTICDGGLTKRQKQDVANIVTVVIVIAKKGLRCGSKLEELV